jgi:hypothetical protein
MFSEQGCKLNLDFGRVLTQTRANLANHRMLRTVEIPLMEFSAKQHLAFCAQDWLDSPLSAPELGTAALLLSYTPWYGHRDELIMISRQLNPAAEQGPPGQMRQVELYPARFEQMVHKLTKSL